MNTNALNARSSLARRQRRGQAPRVECLESRELLTYPAAGVTFLVNEALFHHKNTAFQVIDGVDSRLKSDLTFGPLATLNSAPITTTTATTFLNSVTAEVQTYQANATAQLSPRFPFVWGEIVGNTTRIQNGITAQNALFQVGAINATTFSQNVTAIINGSTVPAAPTITSAGNTTFTVGTAGTFTVMAVGVPTLSLSETGALPGGVTFVDNHNGTATLAGTPAAGSAGTFPLTITAANGVVPNATQSFTLIVAAAVPTVTGLSPTSGPLAGGTSVTITGTSFTGATAVDFGTTAATGVAVVNDTTITATSPAGTGTVDVTVTTPGGKSATSTADQFTYVAAPTVTAITPATGPAAGGTLVTITGTNFTGSPTPTVDFGPTAATNVTVVSATSITADSPPGTASVTPVDVTVTTPEGKSASSSADQFLYS